VAALRLGQENVVQRLPMTIFGLFALMTFWLFINVTSDSSSRTAASSPSARVWQERSRLPEPRKFEVAIAIDGRIYCVTSGDDTGRDGGRIYSYDPSDDSWTRKSRVRIARHSSGFGAVGGRIYAISGALEGNPTLDASGLSAAFEEYDPRTDSWRIRAPIPRPRLFAIGAGVNGKIYAIGGIVPGNPQVSVARWVDEYDTKTDRWTPRADLPLETRACRVAVANGKIYLIGGADRAFSKLLADVIEYDPIADTWTARASMPTPRADYALTECDGRIFAFGGLGEMSATEEYDPTLNLWRTRSRMPISSWLQVAASANGRIYLIGGWDGGWPGGVALNSVLEYRPERDR
jgi:N-acetylneuraminic acid mutarotase